MSQWDDRIRGHRVWELLGSLGPSIDNALKRETLPPESIDSLERIRSILAFSGKRLASSDPILVWPSILDGMATSISQVKNCIDTFTVNGDANQLSTANTQADTVLENTVSILNPQTSDDLSVLSEAAAAYRASLEKNLRAAIELQKALEERSDTNAAKIAELEASLSAEKQRLATLVTDYQSQFSAAQDKRATDFAATQNDQLSRFTTASTEFQTQFSSDQDARRNAFSEFQRTSTEKIAAFVTNATEQLKQHNNDYATKIDEATKNYSDSLAELQKGYSKNAEDILKQMESDKNRVQELVGVIGNLGVTSGYQKVANSAKTSLMFWQFVTSVSLIGLILVAVFTAFPTSSNALVAKQQGAAVTLTANASLNDGKDKSAEAMKADIKAAANPSPITAPTDMVFYHGLATRIFLAITFGIFAGYAGRQASHFMLIERRNRKLALELEALGPFIEPLGLDERNKFRIQVGERSFGVPDNDETHEKLKGDDPVTMWDLLKSKELRDALLDFYNKTKKTGG